MTGRYPISSTMRSDGRHRNRIRFAQLAFAFGLGQNADDVGKACKVDAAAGLHGLDPEGGGEMTLPRAGRPQEVDDLVALDEVELGERQDPVFVERRLEREI